MLQLKPLPLKFLLAFTSFPILLLHILLAKKLQTTTENVIWFGLLGIIVVIRLFIQKEKYETGGIQPSVKTTALAFTTLAAVIYFFFIMFS
jgi:hypothetical protein